MTTQNFFKRNGKTLRTIAFQITQEQVTSVVSYTEPSRKTKVQIFTRLGAKTKTTWAYISNFASSKFSVRYSYAYISLLAFVVFAGMFAFAHNKTSQKPIAKYSIFASTPFVMEYTTNKVISDDPESQKLDGVFKAYGCPLEGMGSVFVREANRNDIPWWIAAAISFQESGCGKKTPKADGEESYNAFGWAVYGENVHMFGSWARAIETVSEYLSNKFFSRGVSDPCDIMRIYTPPSNGSWCEGIKYFGDEIQNFTSDNTL